MPSGHEPTISVRGIRFRQIPEEHHQSRPRSQAERRDHSPDLRWRTVTDQDGRVHSPPHIHRQLPAIERHGNGDSNHGNPAQRRLHTDRLVRERTSHRMGAVDRRGDCGVDIRTSILQWIVIDRIYQDNYFIITFIGIIISMNQKSIRNGYLVP